MVRSPLTAASAPSALKAGLWFRRARLRIVSPDSRANLARRQAETPLIALFRFPKPALTDVEDLSHSLSHSLSHMTNDLPGPVVPPAREGHRRTFSEADKRQVRLAPLKRTFVDSCFDV